MEHSEISDIVMTDKKGYITLNVSFKKEGKIMLRSSSGIQKWFSLIKVNTFLCPDLSFIFPSEPRREPGGGAETARYQGLLVGKAAREH